MIHPRFRYAFAEALGVAKISNAKTADANQDARNGAVVAHGLQPVGKHFRLAHLIMCNLARFAKASVNYNAHDPRARASGLDDASDRGKPRGRETGLSRL